LCRCILNSLQCNLYRHKKDKTLDQHNHSIKEHEGVRCEGCHSRACWYHIAEKYNAHIVTIATFSDAYQALQRRENPVLGVRSFMSDAWHRFHGTGKSTSSSEIPFGQPWADWLPRLALLFRSSRPLNDSVLLGWYDGAHLGVRNEINSSEAIMVSSLGQFGLVLTAHPSSHWPSQAIRAPSNPHPCNPPQHQITLLLFL
jgi:hypothetical protein